MKRFVVLLLTAVLALTMPLSALAAGQIEVTEDISVSDGSGHSAERFQINGRRIL